MREKKADTVAWGATEIPYLYYLSSRKTLSISVYPDLSVIVRAPVGTSLETMRRFVRKRGEWIARAWKKLEQTIPGQPLLRYASGEMHPYLGNLCRLEVDRGERDSVAYVSGCLRLTTKNEPTPVEAKALLAAWYRARAEILFAERLIACHEKAAREGIPMPLLRIRLMRSRWGSFSPGGNMTLNLLLVTAPIECLDYVILHELCHSRVHHHGPEFWKLLAGLLPDYRERRKRLNLCARETSALA